MPGPSNDKDGDAGSLPIPACLGHCCHSVRGNPPHPRLTQCDVLVPRKALSGRHPATTQCARGAEQKEAAASGVGAEGELGIGLQGIQGAVGKCDGVSISGTGVDSGR